MSLWERKKERYNLFLAGALLMLLLDALIGARAIGLARRRQRWLHTGVSTLFLLLVVGSSAEAARRVDRNKVVEGNDYYLESDYVSAFESYKNALGDTLQLPRDYQGIYYNQGNSLYMQEEFDGAIAHYQKSYSPDSTLTGHMMYNRGNAMLKSGNLEGAVESYIQSLNFLPKDEAARHNLEFALRMMQQQQQEQENQDQQNQDQEKQENEDQQQQDQENQDQQNQENQQQQDEDQQEQEQQDEDQQEQNPDSLQSPPAQADSTAIPPPQLSPEDLMKLSPEDALRILQALEEQERKLQKERRRAAFRRLKRSGKDW